MSMIPQIPEETAVHPPSPRKQHSSYKPHQDGLIANRNIIHDNITGDLTTENCMFIITHNYFRFDENFYLQINGAATMCFVLELPSSPLVP